MPLTAPKLFDAYVKPILLYIPALWAAAEDRSKNFSNPYTMHLVAWIPLKKIITTSVNIA